MLFQELYRQDLLDTTFYANDGFLTGRHAYRRIRKMRDRIFAMADEAIHEADVRLSKNSNDIDALFARGWARSLKCTYLAMVQRGFGGGLRLAGKAKDDRCPRAASGSGLCGCQAGDGRLRVCRGRSAPSFKL